MSVRVAGRQVLINAVIVQVGPGMDIPSKGAQLRGDSNDLAVEMMRRIDSRRPSSKR